jgi:hypothetical protein
VPIYWCSCSDDTGHQVSQILSMVAEDRNVKGILAELLGGSGSSLSIVPEQVPANGSINGARAGTFLVLWLQHNGSLTAL